MEIKDMPIAERVKGFQKEYNELATKWGCDFASILKASASAIEAQIAVKDLWDKREAAGHLDKLPN